MYVPSCFAPPDEASLFSAIESHSFAVLVSPTNESLVASHLPLLLDRAASGKGTLLGHMARANAQWQSAAGAGVLAIFSGPHAYISPRWYEAERAVPTWNHVAVHAYGRLELIDDPAQTTALLHRMIEVYEAGEPRPWRLTEPEEYVQRLIQQIVAFRIPIERLEGKWKLNQNRPAEQRAKVAALLEARNDENSRQIAELMRGS